MFRTASDAASRWGSYDDNGIPLTDASGSALPDAALKDLKQQWNAQTKLHKAWLKKQSA
jgi:cysteinyl-tRNA synthetase